MKFLLIAVLAAILTDSSWAINCESNKCIENGEQHVMCKYPTPFPAAECGSIASMGLSDFEKLELVRVHNHYRWYVAQGLEQAGKPGPQPGAKNMQIMVWDNNLARWAQRWVNQCQYKQADCVDDVEGGTKVRQLGAINITTDAVPYMLPTDLIKRFYDQVKDMDRNQVPNYTQRKNMAYTQLVWAKTNKFGCGKIIHQVEINWVTFLMCFYSPAGNVIGESVYEPER
ncbi:unnamed protein product [Xylocopa violacea]|uniref:SCP domain-containing protein n=1 Tax=Xylocopa violacea TaxID=135666 RepID=A0ABP1NAM8_XYLVO